MNTRYFDSFQRSNPQKIILLQSNLITEMLRTCFSTSLLVVKIRKHQPGEWMGNGVPEINQSPELGFEA